MASKDTVFNSLNSLSIETLIRDQKRGELPLKEYVTKLLYSSFSLLPDKISRRNSNS